MKIHGLDLDNSPLISQDKALRYAENIAIGEGNQSYINEDGFEEKFDIVSKVQEYIPDITNLTIIGTIPTNIGVVLFCVSDGIDLIVYIKTDTDKPTIQKILYSDNLNFDVSRPIHGDYIYNYKEELIVTFTEGIDTNANETRVINLTTPYGGQYDTNSTILYNITDVSSLNLIPDIEYPKMIIDVEEGGNLKTGAYQIAISYKLQDGTYTNYSILSVPVIVCGNYGEDYAPNSEINRKIIVSFDKPNVSYNTYKLGIVHCNGISQDCYETEDIPLENELNTYTISNLNNYNTIILDDIFIKNISYIREQTLVNYNNRLIRGNVQTLNYQDLHNELETFTHDNLNVNISIKNPNSYINKSKAYFKLGECYVLFAGYFDYKGDLINIYKIPVKNNDYKLNDDNPYVHYINPNLINTTKVDIGDINRDFMSLLTHKINNYYIIRSNDNTTDYYNIKPSNVPLFINQTYINDSVITITNLRDYDIEYNIKLDPTIKYEEILSSGTIRVSLYSVQLRPMANAITYYTLDKELYTIEKEYTKESTVKLNDIFTYTTTIQANKSFTCAIVIEVIDNGEYKHSCILNKPDLNDYSIIGNTAEISIRNNILTNSYIKSIAYFYIEHNTYNSRILSQALCIPDTNEVNFAANQSYTGQFKGKYALRFYPFEYIYNKISKLKTIVDWKYSLGELQGETIAGESQEKAKIKFPDTFKFGGELSGTYAVFKTIDNDDDASDNGDSLTKYVRKHGVKILDCDISNLTNLDLDLTKTINLEYISADNTSQQNIAGDSYYRTKDLTIVNYPNYSDDDADDMIYEPTIADLINPATNLYSNLDNQKLQIASSIIPTTSIENTALSGDTYLSYLTLRITTPAPAFRYGDSEAKELDSNSTVFRWILTFPIESKYNIVARYSDNIIDKPYFLHDAILQKYVELLGTSYKVDNYINTNVGKGYNPVYNENGIEQFSYYKEIPGTSNHPHRIIRSLAQNPESIALNWRTFKTDDYKDLPFNRGNIISLKTDNKNLYIQQKYGLHLLQQRDQLNNDDTNNSYLGTSDLFNMEPKEIVYSPSGYIGCESYFDTDVNISGYVVIDAVHKKIFLVNGDKPLEISNIKTREYFEKLIDANLINPYNKQGRIINYNEDRNILYITQINNNYTDSKTMSFSPLNKAWVSFHTYIPDLGFVNRNGLFWGKNGKLYQPNSTIKGKYFGTMTEPSVIQFILNENTIYNKLLKTIVWKDQVSYKGDDYIQHFFKETINHIMVHNFDQCSGKLNVAFNNNPKEWWNGDTGTNKINLWRFNKLFDLVKPDDTSLFMKDAITPDPDKLKVDYKWYDVNRFICQFIYLTLWCNNTNDHEWELIDVYPEWQLDNRNDQTYGNKDNNQ